MNEHKTSIDLYAVGDVTLGDHPMCVGFGADSWLSRRPGRDPFHHVRAVLAPADVRFGSLECVLSTNGFNPQDYQSAQMRGRPEYAALLERAGFSIMNLATNHTLQHGPGPFLETIETLNRHRIACCGVSLEDHRVVEPVILEEQGCRLAFIGYSLRPRQYFSRSPLYTEGTVDRPEAMVRAVSEVREEADFVVVSLHWGDEFVPRPSPEEIRLARSLIDAGAGLILGHHPHVLRGVERYRDGIIAYSLGNFVCDMGWGDALRETMVLRCRIRSGTVVEHTCVPVVINGNYQPVPARDAAARRILERLSRMSDGLEEEDLGDFAAKSTLYREESYRYEQRYRKMSHRFFLRNVHRFPFALLRQQMVWYFRNRYRELAGRFGRRK